MFAHLDSFFASFFAKLKWMVTVPSIVQALFTQISQPICDSVQPRAKKTSDEFLVDVGDLFKAPIRREVLLDISQKLQDEFRRALRQDSSSMLPSFNHTLPAGDERGTYLALDVGGSTLRVALVELQGRTSRNPLQITRMQSWNIDSTVKALEGHKFFDWMAERIEDMLATDRVKHKHDDNILHTGLAWSFPLRQTSLQSGAILSMGKGFAAASGVLGEDLGDLIQEACERRNLRIRLAAIVNDSCATILAEAYVDPSTHFALILGTGVNAAIHLPTGAIGQEKFGKRSQTWHEKAQHVIVNTELSKFGKGILPTTCWDDHLNVNHSLPDFQPFEHLVSGRYLGEIARLVLVEAIQTTDLFGGRFPSRILEPYALDTGTLSAIAADHTPTLSHARESFTTRHPCTVEPSHADLVFLRRIASHISNRASAYVATAIHALWQLRNKAEDTPPERVGCTSIGCNGAVLENYPGFEASCQSYLDMLVEASDAEKGSVMFKPVVHSALLGAAVGVVCSEADQDVAQILKVHFPHV